MPLTARLQLLMDPKELRELRQIAKRTKTSVGKLVRVATQEKYFHAAGIESRRRAVDRIRDMNHGPVPDWPKLKKELDARYDDICPDLP